MSRNIIIAEPPRYYRGRLWKVSATIHRIGWRVWRYVKFYERREAVGAPWKIVHHAAYEQRRALRSL